MNQIDLTQGKFALVDDEDFEWLNQWKWVFNNGYAVVSKYMGGGSKNTKRVTIYMHRLVNNTPKGFETDHVNRNKLDNRKKNLRIASKSLNSINRGLRKDNTSGYKGVGWMEKRKKWYASIMINQKSKSLGYFNIMQDAILARQVAERKYHAII